MDVRSWEEFRKTGLFLFVNSFLHIFGWSLIYDVEKDIVFPARTSWRGFREDKTFEAYEKLQAYMEENVTELRKDFKDGKT